MRYIIVVVSIVLFISATAILLFGRSGPSPQIGQPKDLTVAEFADRPGSEVVWIQQGAIVGDDAFRSVRITVSSSSRTGEIIQGYQGRVIKRVNFTNNKNAYQVFLKALDKLRFGIQRQVQVGDEQGACPLGLRYIYALNDGGEQKLRSWSDSCSDRNGIFAGDARTVRALFQNQITDYRDFISGVRF